MNHEEPTDPTLDVRVSRLERSFFGWQDEGGVYNAGMAQTFKDFIEEIQLWRKESQDRENAKLKAEQERTATIVSSIRWAIGIVLVNFLVITHVLDATWNFLATHLGGH